jgi:flagellar hook protein FlgE
MSNIHHSIFSGYNAVNEWQARIIKKANNLTTTGVNDRSKSLSQTGGGSGLDSLKLTDGQLEFQQKEVDPTEISTQLAIRGNGFFLVAENLLPGAKLFLTRNGEFKYDAQGRLVNNQGLFVVGGAGKISDPPLPVRNPGDETVDVNQLTLGTVPLAMNLADSPYGNNIYSLSSETGDLAFFANGRREVGFVQSNALEKRSDTVLSAELGKISLEGSYAAQMFKTFKEILDNYNRMVDDAIQTVK